MDFEPVLDMLSVGVLVTMRRELRDSLDAALGLGFDRDGANVQMRYDAMHAVNTTLCERSIPAVHKWDIPALEDWTVPTLDPEDDWDIQEQLSQN